MEPPLQQPPPKHWEGPLLPIISISLGEPAYYSMLLLFRLPALYNALMGQAELSCLSRTAGWPSLFPRTVAHCGLGRQLGAAIPSLLGNSLELPRWTSQNHGRPPSPSLPHPSACTLWNTTPGHLANDAVRGRQASSGT